MSSKGVFIEKIYILEKWIKTNLHFFYQKTVLIRKLKSNAIIPTSTYKNIPQPFRISNTYKKTIYLDIQLITKENDIVYHTNYISDINLYSQKFFCELCLKKFNKKYNLEKHKMSSKSCKHTKTANYIGGRLIQKPINPLTAVKQFKEDMFLDNDTTFIAVTSKNDNICVSIFSYQQSTILFHTEKTVPNHDAAVSFVFNFLLFSPDNRIQRIEKNIKLINEIEKKITKNTSTLTDNGILSIENQEKQELDALRNFLKQYFSHRQIFLLPFQDKILERKSTWALLEIPIRKKNYQFQ